MATTSESTLPENDDGTDGFLHHWVECNDMIIDITADQFHRTGRKPILILPVETDFYQEEEAAAV